MGYRRRWCTLSLAMAEVLPSEELIDEASDFGALRPGTRLGRYELLVPIARGGMARVWAARLQGQRGFSKLVAIKTILPHLANEPEFERMFLDEARIASGVHHPNVCEIYELGEERRTLYLAMEWVSGDSFSRVLRASGKTEPIEPRVAARIVADASAGLHAAHELSDDAGTALGVVHRDLSPHNILLTADGVAKVADFGVAKALGQLHDATSAGQLKGKVAYMAPEQIAGSAIDRRSDIFSLGCVLYEATTGVRPFRGDGEAQIMHAVLKGEFPAPSTIVRNFPPELERVILRALAPQPILRFPTAERMRFALEEFLAARGQLVTQSNVAQVIRTRIGDPLEKRKERIRQAEAAGDHQSGEVAGVNTTPSNQRQEHHSGVKSAGRPYTLQIDGRVEISAHGMSSDAPPASRAPSRMPPPLDPARVTGHSSAGFGDGRRATPVVGPGAPPVAIPRAPSGAEGMISSHGRTPPPPMPGATMTHATEYLVGPERAAAFANDASSPAFTPSPSAYQAPPAVRPSSHPHFTPAPTHGDPMGQMPSHPHHAASHPSHASHVGYPHVPGPQALGFPYAQGPLDHGSPVPVAGPPRTPSVQNMLAVRPPDPAMHGPMSSGGLPSGGLPSSGDWSTGGLASGPPTTGDWASQQPYPTGPIDPRQLPGHAPSGVVPIEQGPAGAGSYVLAAAVGILVAAIIGGAGFFVWRAKAHPTASAPVVQPAPVDISSAPLGASASASSAASAVAKPSPELTFHVTPENATLSVDGRDLGTARTIPRPEAGKNATVIVKAPGFDESTVLVDYFSHTPLDVSLKVAPTTSIELGDGKPEAPGDPPSKPSDAKSDPKTGDSKPADPAKPSDAKPKPDRHPSAPAARPDGKKEPSAVPANPY